MRIQRQSETFTWRVARKYQDEEWEARRQHVEDVLRHLYAQKDPNGFSPDSRTPFGRIIRNNKGKEVDYQPTDADRQMLYNQAIQIMRDTGGPGNYEATGGRGLSQIARDHSALLMAGIGGAGKGSILKHQLFGPRLGYGSHYVINPDDTALVMARLGMVPDKDELKERYGLEIPGYEDLSPMELKPFIHEEASWLTKKLGRQLQDEGYNVIYDGTLGKTKKIDELTNQLRAAGYSPDQGGHINAALVDQDMQEGLRRAYDRHRRGQEKYLDFLGDSFNIDHPRPQILSIGDEDRGDQGGRALPAHIHSENSPPEGSTSRSLPAHNFPYTQSKTDSSIIFDGLYPMGGTPDILGGHGPDFQDLIPPDRMRKAGRAVLAAEEGKPLTVREIVKLFNDNEIDLGQLVYLIARRLREIEEENEDYEYSYHDSHVADSDEIGHWLDGSVEKGKMTEEERADVMEALMLFLNG